MSQPSAPETVSDNIPSLCRFGTQSCGACCWGANVERTKLETRLRRNRIAFEQTMKSGTLNRLRLLWHETQTQRGLNLVWAVALRVPGIRQKLKRWLAVNLVCSFVGFDSETEERVGCLLHPTQRQGEDIRNQSAFRWLPGIECGDPEYICNACHRYDNLSNRNQMAFATAVNKMDWFDFTNSVRAFSCGYAGKAASANRTKPVAQNPLLPIIEENAA